MYNPKKAANYWNSRIDSVKLKPAVLSLGASQFLNNAYANWESQILQKELSSIRGKKIVDLACGGGRVSIPLAKKGAKVTGVDIAPKMLRFAEKNAKKNSCASNLTLVNSPVWNTKLPSNYFDKVLLLGILEHLPDKYKKLTMKEAHRIAKKNGKIFIVINNKKSIFLSQVKKWKKPKQAKTGYYSSLMNPMEIMKFLKSLKMKPKIVNSNLNYSLAYHLFEKFDSNISKDQANKIENLFEYLINQDVDNKKNSKNYSLLEHNFADQFFIVTKK